MQKKLNDKLVEECTENIGGNKMIYNATSKQLWESVQFLQNIHSIAFLMIMSISVFIYFRWYFKRSNTIINTNTETIIYQTYKWKVSKKLLKF